MCGIAGILSPSGVDRRLLEAFGTMLQHRGPDGQGIWIDEGNRVGLVHRRLAIVDLTPTGEQPMRSNDGRWILSFNGEIYNHRELRSRLNPQVGWRGTSDTETLLAAIEAWGVAAAIGAAAGMFAISLFDTHARQLLLIRDRFGEKPLYYGWCGSDFVFASEIKALRRHPQFDDTLDTHAVDQMLRYAAVSAPHSIFASIRKLPPASILRIDVDRLGDRDVAIETYWDYARVAAPAGDRQFGTEAEALDGIEAALALAIGEQAVADVPVGAFLSGGIDSTTIVALYRKYTTGTVNTFTIGFADAGYDESTHARAVAAYLGTKHIEQRVGPDEAMAVIPQLPTIYDEPFADMSQIPTYLVSALARRSVTVALSGDGGDELFGGYNRHIAGPRLWNVMARLPAPLRVAIGTTSGLVPAALWDTALRLAGAQGGQRGAKLRDAVHAAATSRSIEGVHDAMIDPWGRASPMDRDAAPVAHLPSGLPPALAMMVRDAQTYLPDDVLTKVDRAAMACSLETRAPFLDHRVAEAAARVPLRMKISGGTGKALLRKLVAREVPQTLIDRPKAGFSVPIGKWLRGPLRDWAEHLLSDKALHDAQFLNVPAIRARWHKHLHGEGGHDQAIWSVLMFQAWRIHSSALAYT